MEAPEVITMPHEQETEYKPALTFETFVTKCKSFFFVIFFNNFYFRFGLLVHAATG